MSIRVALGTRSYAIAIADSYRQLPQQLTPLGLAPYGWVISHQRLFQRYGKDLLAPLQQAGWRLETLTVPESERSKSWAIAQGVIERISRRTLMRVPVIFAFGGGVIGDLAGFVAAVFRRGVPYVQLPTTFLAQVDSGIGGKVGVDLPHGKNLVGAFHQPRLVYNNVAVLRTLPMRQRRSGLAEVIKYGVIADRALFEFIERHRAGCLKLGPREVRVMVERSCRIKANVVSRDEQETGDVRIRLNFGHTLGHALEAATGYRRWTHGEAIAIGMCAAAHISVELGQFDHADFQRVVRLIRAVGLPTHATGVKLRSVLSALRYDKKFIHGRPRWVLPTRIGCVIVTEAVPAALVKQVLSAYLK